jgi:hypothetical protein
MKKLISLGMITMLVFSLVACGYGGTAYTSSWSTRNLTHNSRHESWMITADSVNGHAMRRIDLSIEELFALHVNSSNSDGSISATLTQGDTVEVFDISGEFSDNLDTSNFEAGKIRLRLDFDNAIDVDLFVNWGS